MTDLKQHFSVIDGLSQPSLWSEIERRASSADAPRSTARLPDSHGTGQRLAAALVALLVFLSAGALVWTAFRPEMQAQRHEPVDPWSAFGVGWTRLPDPPEVRSGTATVWTGSVYLDWGGRVKGTHGASADGYAFDPSTRTWSMIPPAPISRIGAQAVWTGTLAIFWNGFGHDRGGAAYEPVSKTWKVVPPAPLPNRGDAVVWTGTEMIVWGGNSEHGAAFDPTTWTWRRIADGPNSDSEFVAVWTGKDVLVLGGAVNTPSQPVPSPVGGAYDPVTNTWRQISQPPLGPYTTGAWVDGRLLAYDYSTLASASFDPLTGKWTRLARLPFKVGDCSPLAAAVGHSVIAYGCGRAASWDLGSGWRRLNAGPRYESVHLSAAGSVAVIEGVTNGGFCFGCPAAPHPYWVYRPGPSPS